MKYFKFIPGINTDANDRSQWCYKMCHFVENNRLGVGDVFGYKVGALDRWFWQSRNAAKLADELNAFGDIKGGDQLVLVGHSNGCALICEALKQAKSFTADEIHLFAAACDASFEDNGLNDAYLRQRVDRAYLYCSYFDEALKLANWSNKLLGFTKGLHNVWSRFPRLGYGDLGREGPKDVLKQFPVSVNWRQYRHSEYFEGKNFEEAVNNVLHP